MPYTSTDSDPGNTVGSAYDKGRVISSRRCYSHCFVVDIDGFASAD